MQGKVRKIQRDAVNTEFARDRRNPQPTYASLAAVIGAIHDALSESGVVVTHRFARVMMPTIDNEGQATHVPCIRTTCTILAPLGGELSASVDVPCVRRTKFGLQDNAHTTGAACTYGRRYTLTAVLGLAEADDDGNELADAPGAQQAQPRPDGNAQQRPEAVFWAICQRLGGVSKAWAALEDAGEEMQPIGSVADAEQALQDAGPKAVARWTQILRNNEVAR